MKIRRKINLLREFGLKVCLADFCASNIRLPRITARWKDKVLITWLREKYDYVIQRYLRREQVHIQNDDNALPCVWSMWWQGENDLPEVIELCLTNIRKHCGKHPLRIITKDNYREYIDLPEYIIDKVKAGVITLTHLSDIIRMYLLYHYGGMWIDATILVTQDIPEEIFAADYYTINRGMNINDFNVSMRRWTGCLQAAGKANEWSLLVLDIMLEYWKTHTMLADYVMIDYIIAMTYEVLPECRAVIDAVPEGNYAFDDLQPVLNDIFDENKYYDMTCGTQFFKLTYKHVFMKVKHGQETFYGHITRKLLYEKNNFSPSDA